MSRIAIGVPIVNIWCTKLQINVFQWINAYQSGSDDQFIFGIPEFDDPGRKWDAGTGTQVGTGNRDAGGTREPGRRWDPKFFPI